MEFSLAALVVFAGYVVYFLLVALGLPANVFVLMRMLQFKRSAERHRISDASMSDRAPRPIARGRACVSSQWPAPTWPPSWPSSTQRHCPLTCPFPSRTSSTPSSARSPPCTCSTVFSLSLSDHDIHHAHVHVCGHLVVAFDVHSPLAGPLPTSAPPDTLESTAEASRDGALRVFPHQQFLVRHRRVFRGDREFLFAARTSQRSCTSTWLFGSRVLTRCLLLAELSWSFLVPIGWSFSQKPRTEVKSSARRESQGPRVEGGGC